jgi:hypothetical protein
LPAKFKNKQNVLQMDDVSANFLKLFTAGFRRIIPISRDGRAFAGSGDDDNLTDYFVSQLSQLRQLPVICGS